MEPVHMFGVTLSDKAVTEELDRREPAPSLLEKL